MFLNNTMYLNLVKNVYDNGILREDRTGVGTKSLFGLQAKYDLSTSFPLFTVRELNWSSIASEMLWFLEGSADERRLAELRHGRSRNVIGEKITIWSANLADYNARTRKKDSSLGEIYGKQWRNFNYTVDQIMNLVKGLKSDPYSRRHIVTAWNPEDIEEPNNQALPPCHVMFQMYVDNQKKLHCMLFQRSCDLFLGCPYNVANYSLLIHLLAQECGYDVGTLTHSIGDAHIYLDHLDQVKEMLNRVPIEDKVTIDVSKINLLKGLTGRFPGESVRRITITGYHPHPKLKGKMAV